MKDYPKVCEYGIDGKHCFCLPGDPVAWRMNVVMDMNFSCCWCGEKKLHKARITQVDGHGQYRKHTEWVPNV